MRPSIATWLECVVDQPHTQLSRYLQLAFETIRSATALLEPQGSEAVHACRSMETVA